MQKEIDYVDNNNLVEAFDWNVYPTTDTHLNITIWERLYNILKDDYKEIYKDEV